MDVAECASYVLGTGSGRSGKFTKFRSGMWFRVLEFRIQDFLYALLSIGKTCQSHSGTKYSNLTLFFAPTHNTPFPPTSPPSYFCLIPIRQDRVGRPWVVHASEGFVIGAHGGGAVRLDAGSGDGSIPKGGGDGCGKEGMGCGAGCRV